MVERTEVEILESLASKAIRYMFAHAEIMSARKRNDFCSVRLIQAKTSMSEKDICEAISFLLGPFGHKYGFKVYRKLSEVAGPIIVVNGEVFNLIKLEKQDV